MDDKITQAAVLAQGNYPAKSAINVPTGALFKIKDKKL